MKRTVWPFERRPRWWWRWRIAGFLVFFAALTVTNLLWDGPLAAELGVLAFGGTVQIAVLVATERRWKREKQAAAAHRASRRPSAT